MALPARLQSGLTPDELEFCAEYEERVDVVPSHRLERTRFISETIGPLVAGRKSRIPIWLATTLKKQRRCRIIAPDWMAVEHLEDLLKAETTRENFSALPERHMEVARLLLEAAPDDIPDVERIRSLLKDLREVRQAKARQGIVAMDPTALNISNMGSLELNEVRPFLTLAWSRMIALDPLEAERIERGFVKDVEPDAVEAPGYDPSVNGDELEMEE